MVRCRLGLFQLQRLRNSRIGCVGDTKEKSTMLRSYIGALALMVAGAVACTQGDSKSEDAAGQAKAGPISISCGSTGQDLEICKQAVETWSKKTGIEAKVVTVPSSTTEMLALYQQLLAAKSTDIDVFNVDVIWPGILGQHFLNLKPYSHGAENQHFPSIIANNTVGGKLVAMPLNADAGVLYYRKDLLEAQGLAVPDTWEALTEAAKKVQDAGRAAGKDKLWGFVWQGKAYEGLTCNALEWIASHGGGTIIDKDGKVTLNNEAAAAAVKRAASWVGTISPPGVLNYGEEEARGVFQSGNAVFMRNWPYAWALSQGNDSPVKGKVGVAPIPRGGTGKRGASALGGWQLAVSKYSKNPAAAADLVMFMTGATEQKRRAITASVQPTIPSVYQDAEVLAANPFFGELLKTFEQAVPRPSSVTGSRYNEISNRFWNSVYSVLAGRAEAEQSLAQVEPGLNRLMARAR